MKVLLIENDTGVVSLLRKRFPGRGFVVDTVSDGRRGVSFARVNEYDLIIIDPDLPDMHGEDVIRSIRRQDLSPPILMLAAIGDVSSKVRCLNTGADDYLVSPFDVEELVARMRALLRRPAPMIPDIFSIGDLEVNVGSQTVQRGTQRLMLTRKEFAMLEHLLRRRGNLVSKSSLIEHVWDSSIDPFSTSIETHMANLRRKLGIPEMIETVHSRGYLIR